MNNFTVTQVNQNDHDRWNRYVTEHPGSSIYHRFEIAELIEQVFCHQSYYFKSSDEQGNIVGVLPVIRLKSRLFGDYFVSLPFFNYGGVIADSAEIATDLIRAAAQQATNLGVSHLELRQLEPAESDLELRQDKIVMIKTLPDSREALQKSFKTKLRAQIKRPVREGATVRVGNLELLSDFYRVFSENMRDLGTPVYSINFFKTMINQNWLDTTIVVVYLDGEATAAGFLIKDGSCMEIPWASTRSQFNRFSVNMLLYSEALGTAIDQGCTSFDFGRSSVDSGTYRFKKQWGATPVQLNWQYWLRDGEPMPALTPSNPKYGLAIKAWQKLPLPIANFIGPAIVRNLP